MTTTRSRRPAADNFLASPASRFVTGTAVPIDGGYAVAERLLHREAI
ncbi:MAG: hypothetical protein HYU88_01095 [Chloroflexi bacterium]|nr:hypothetical protein [Chloroflexota bacterium]